MKDIAGLTFKLLLICVLSAAVLGVAYVFTIGPIEEGALERAKASRQTVLNEAESFEAVDVEGLRASGAWQDNAETGVTIDEAFIGMNNGEAVGMTVKVTTKGYNPGIEMTIGFKADGTVEKVNIESHSETPGLGANATNPSFLSQFAVEKPYFTIGGGSAEVSKTVEDNGNNAEATSGASEDESVGGQQTEIDALTSATFTTNGVVNGINAAYDFFKSVYGKE